LAQPTGWFEARWLYGFANDGDRNLEDAGGAASQNECYTIFGRDCLSAPCLPSLARLDVRSVWDSHEEQTRLFHMVDSVRRVRLEFLPDLSDVRCSPLDVGGTPFASQCHVVKIVAGRPVLNKMGGPLEARHAQPHRNPPRPSLQKTTRHKQVPPAHDLKCLIPVPQAL